MTDCQRSYQDQSVSTLHEPGSGSGGIRGDGGGGGGGGAGVQSERHLHAK